MLDKQCIQKADSSKLLYLYEKALSYLSQLNYKEALSSSLELIRILKTSQTTQLQQTTQNCTQINQNSQHKISNNSIIYELVYTIAAQSSIGLKHYQDAIIFFSEALDKSSTPDRKLSLLIGRVEMYIISKKYKKALRDINTIRELIPSGMVSVKQEMLLKQAICFMHLREYAKAYELLCEAMKMFKFLERNERRDREIFAQILFHRCVAYYLKQENKKLKMSEFTKAFGVLLQNGFFQPQQQSPHIQQQTTQHQSGDLHFLIGQEYISRKQYRFAVRHLLLALNNKLVWFDKSMIVKAFIEAEKFWSSELLVQGVNWLQKDPEKALEYYYQMCKTGISPSVSCYELGAEALIALKKYEEAIEVCSEGIQTHKNGKEVYKLYKCRAMAYERKEMLHEATEDLIAAWMKHPELDEFTDKVKADLSCIKAKLETRYGNYRKALVHYDKALSKKEGHLFLRKEIEENRRLVEEKHKAEVEKFINTLEQTEKKKPAKQKKKSGKQKKKKPSKHEPVKNEESNKTNEEKQTPPKAEQTSSNSKEIESVEETPSSSVKTPPDESPGKQKVKKIKETPKREAEHKSKHIPKKRPPTPRSKPKPRKVKASPRKQQPNGNTQPPKTPTKKAKKQKKQVHNELASTDEQYNVNGNVKRTLSPIRKPARDKQSKHKTQHAVRLDWSQNLVNIKQNIQQERIEDKQLPIYTGISLFASQPAWANIMTPQLSPLGSAATTENSIQQNKMTKSQKRKKKIEHSPKRKLNAIGKLRWYNDESIGKGHLGHVYRGTYENTACIIKVINKKMAPNASREIDNILQICMENSDLPQSIIRYYDKEEDEDNVYVAMELCEQNLHSFISNNKSISYTLKLRAMHELASAVKYLHSMHIVHNDVKPQNILVVNNQFKITDMGITKKIDHRESVSGNSRLHFNDPLHKGKMDYNSDIFSLGCVFYYILTQGEHPFGESNRQINISDQKQPDLNRLTNPVEHHLISWMLDRDPNQRPSAQDVCSHPLFWTDAQQLSFIHAFSTEFSERQELDQILKQGNPKSWDKHLDKPLWKYLCSQSSYDGNNYLHLVSAIKVLDENWRDVMEKDPEATKLFMPQNKVGLWEYFKAKFPYLLINAWICYRRCSETG